MGRALPAVIDAEQTAFLPGRRIGENILALQLLPHVLADDGRYALAAFCDFRKAYDTVDRGFLMQVMDSVYHPASAAVAALRSLPWEAATPNSS